MSKPPSQWTIYKNRTINYVLTEGEESQYVSVDTAEIVIDKPYVCKALAQISSKKVKTGSAIEETAKTSKLYTFDITKAEAIFDQLLSLKIIKLRLGHNIPKAEELKGRTYCKYHNSTKHATNNCVIFRDDIQSWIDKGKLKFSEKRITVDTDQFPSTTVGMVDACLPKSKGKEKVEFAPPKETTGSRDDRPTPTIMAELQGQKETNRDFETTIEVAEKRIKLLLRPGEMKAGFEQFKKEA
ncbi:hypothetical protein FF2_018763 [Malus domestica]